MYIVKNIQVVKSKELKQANSVFNRNRFLKATKQFVLNVYGKLKGQFQKLSKKNRRRQVESLSVEVDTSIKAPQV